MTDRRAGLRAILAAAIVVVTGCVAGWAASAQPTPSTSAAPLELTVTTDLAEGLRFLPAEIRAPARAHVRVTLRNLSTESHNLTFQAPIAAATRTIVEAGGSDVVDFVTPGPGRYAFVCTIHMEMSGTLEVE